MKEHPILFSTPMVQAILEGRKTQTRRILKKDIPENVTTIDRYNKTGQFTLWENRRIVSQIGESPYGQPGDRLWVREKFAESNFTLNGVTYFANAHPEMDLSKKKWKPSIHMPKAAARIWLEIEDVKVERLQDISEEDAKSEGILPLLASSMQLITQGQLYFDYSKPKQFFNEGLPAFWSFNSLWCSTNGPESWEANPWVWVIKFKVLSITGAANIQAL